MGLLFGCEASGLPNHALEMADLISYIPLAVDYPSLNLAQAVMLYAYELAPLNQITTKARTKSSDTERELHHLKQRIRELLIRLEVDDDQKLSEWLSDSVGLFASRDVRLLHTLLTDIQRKLKD